MRAWQPLTGGSPARRSSPKVAVKGLLTDDCPHPNEAAQWHCEERPLLANSGDDLVSDRQRDQEPQGSPGADRDQGAPEAGLGARSSSTSQV